MIYKHSQKKYPFARRKKIRRGGPATLRDRQQRKCPFARRKIRRGGLAKKGSRQGRKKSLCAFPTLRLCVNKNPRRRTRNAAGQAAKKRRRKENTSLRLCYSAPLREQKSAAADPQRCGTGSKGEKTQRSRPLCGFAALRLCVNKKKNISQRRRGAKKNPLCGLAPLRELKRKTACGRQVGFARTYFFIKKSISDTVVIA